MNKKQITKLKNTLEENKRSLEEMLGRFAQKDNLPEGDWETSYPNFNGNHQEEEADEVEEYSSLLPVEHALETKLKNIEEALKKIEQGTYGKCEKCEKEISYKKLSVSPESKYCKDCL